MFRTTVGAASERGRRKRIGVSQTRTGAGNFYQFQKRARHFAPQTAVRHRADRKAFRNEVTPGNLFFRTREFEQMEMEYFCRPEDAPRIHQEFIDAFQEWFYSLGIFCGESETLRTDKSRTRALRGKNVDILYRFSPNATTKKSSLMN
jgi:glycyl-tRNA synthetase